MSKPISTRQLIVAAIQARLKTVNGGANWNSDFSSGNAPDGSAVYIWRATPWGTDETIGIDIRDGKSAISPDSEDETLWYHKLKVDIEAGYKGSTPTQGPADFTRLILADIYTAIWQDDTWSGIALKTIPQTDELETDEEDKKFAGSMISIEIHYNSPAGQD